MNAFDRAANEYFLGRSLACDAKRLSRRGIVLSRGHLSVYLAIDRAAALEAVKLAQKGNIAVWIGSDALSNEEITASRLGGVNLTRFAYPLSYATAGDITFALGTIEEHHPDETIWVQHVSREVAV